MRSAVGAISGNLEAPRGQKVFALWIERPKQAALVAPVRSAPETVILNVNVVGSKHGLDLKISMRHHVFVLCVCRRIQTLGRPNDLEFVFAGGLYRYISILIVSGVVDARKVCFRRMS
jgi:hypothetical protein